MAWRNCIERLKHLRLRTLFFSVIFLLTAVCGVLAMVTYENPIPGKLAREAENTRNKVVNDVTELNPISVVDIVVPHTIEEVADAVKKHSRVSIGGGRNSMGGQTASERAVQIDMREYNQILSFDREKKEITVQAGIRWRDIQDYIDPYDLSVKIMRTYSNFTVGGSLSVNVHGRYIGLGPVILSVKGMRLVLADGAIVEATPEVNSDLYYSVIGGMGGIAVISDVTLALADNVNVERSRVKMPTEEYLNYFKDNVRDSQGVVFHNGDMYPPNFEHVSAVSWSETEKGPTTEDRLIPRQKDYWLERMAWVVMSEWPAGRWIREYIIDPLLYFGDQPVHTRNYEASYDVAELEPEKRTETTYVLQEYFVPIESFDTWVPKMKKVFADYDVNVINVSIRHALPDTGAKLAWAKKECFAFVVYYKQGTDEESKAVVGRWTRALIDEVLSVGGTYYLPYQLLATDDQFHRAYPGAIEYFELKQQYDPTNKFTNKLWDKYYSEEKLEGYKKEQASNSLIQEIPDYARAYDNAYVALPEWYIVYSADEYAATLEGGRPSQFGYGEAIHDYYVQYREVLRLTAESEHNNSDYVTVLRVIGLSFALENSIKGVYEHTSGRVFEWLSGDVVVPEDVFAAQVAREYATFIYDYPWYDFPYFAYLKALWKLEDDTDRSFGQGMRRLERKIFLTFELGVKTLYSKAIAAVTHATFGIQDDIITVIISRDGGATRELMQAPHYHPFTRALLHKMNEARTRQENFVVLEIAGNDRITFSYLDSVGAFPVENTREILRDSEVRRIDGETKTVLDRITAEVSVRDLFSVYTQLSETGREIEHFYDY